MYDKDKDLDAGSKETLIRRLVIAAYDECSSAVRKDVPEMLARGLDNTMYKTSQFMLIVPMSLQGVEAAASANKLGRHNQTFRMTWPKESSTAVFWKNVMATVMKDIKQRTLVIAADVLRANNLLQYFSELGEIQPRLLMPWSGLSMYRRHKKAAREEFFPALIPDVEPTTQVLASAE